MTTLADEEVNFQTSFCARGDFNRSGKGNGVRPFGGEGTQKSKRWLIRQDHAKARRRKDSGGRVATGCSSGAERVVGQQLWKFPIIGFKACPGQRHGPRDQTISQIAYDGRCGSGCLAQELGQLARRTIDNERTAAEPSLSPFGLAHSFGRQWQRIGVARRIGRWPQKSVAAGLRQSVPTCTRGVSPFWP